MKKTVTILCFCIVTAVFSQSDKIVPFRVGFYNLENLFDTINDFDKDDYEFLPNSQKHWNSVRYNQKINHMARSIASMENWQGPDILGVCEVEHKSCLEDLVNQPYLSVLNYGIVHQESSDLRGIDVACIYKKDKIELIDYQYIKVNFDFESSPTRDILYVKGKPMGADTLHLFFNHWPSRRGGEENTAYKRATAAKTLRKFIDSLFAINPNANILVTGDFNDEAADESILTVLGASPKIHADSSKSYLFNTSYALKYDKKLGSYRYQEEWDLFDQIIVSNALLDSTKAVFCRPKDSKIHSDKLWLSETDNYGAGIKPKRTYIGNVYNKGYSDHYAVSIVLWISKP